MILTGVTDVLVAGVAADGYDCYDYGWALREILVTCTVMVHGMAASE